jgi:hypothetical protein
MDDRLAPAASEARSLRVKNVIPAKAGISLPSTHRPNRKKSEIPAFAGMT